MENRETVAVFFPPLGGPSDEQVAQAAAILAERGAAEHARRATALVKCTTQAATGKGCGTMHAVGDLEYIQTHWYVSPHGCSGGDYWKAGEGQWKCPSCDHLNRLYASPDVAKLKYSFKSIKDAHDDR